MEVLIKELDRHSRLLYQQSYTHYHVSFTKYCCVYAKGLYFSLFALNSQNSTTTTTAAAIFANVAYSIVDTISTCGCLYRKLNLSSLALKTFTVKMPRLHCRRSCWS